MGSFSWLKADDLTRVKNIVYGKPFKFLIPKEFGGGFIKDNYQDYGHLGRKDDGTAKYDMYELLALWNMSGVQTVQKYVYPDFIDVKIDFDSLPKMKEIDDLTNEIRGLGIDLDTYKERYSKLKYPLKLVSASYKGTYEDCKGISLDDPMQGSGPIYRDGREI